MTDRTTTVFARVPETLVSQAASVAREARPNITKSGIVRLALAMLARVPVDLLDSYAAEMPSGRQPKARSKPDDSLAP